MVGWSVCIRRIRDRVLAAIQGLAEQGGRTWSGAYRFRRKDGSYASVMDRGFILDDAAGKPVRIVGGISDVTEQRQAEQALENSRRQLRALSARLAVGARRGAGQRWRGKSTTNWGRC